MVQVQKLAEAMTALTEAEADKNKKKASVSTPMATPKLDARKATPACSVACKPAAVEHAQVTTRVVIDEM
jgi:hypothetical protein